ncbi:MAG: hypothetical protein JRC99_12050, partial [Deltaproteobacteria bacterium]|nr:hypothetical protein [Deltaproteobacteria bacterium]
MNDASTKAPRGGCWRGSSVRQVLTNTMYT